MTTDDLIRIQLEVISGQAWGHPATKVPQTPENHAKWDTIARENAEIVARGGIPEIPHEIAI